jgi:hypothetical protein
MAPYISTLSALKVQELAVPAPRSCQAQAQGTMQGSEACLEDKPCYSHGSFEDYDYEQELDRWLTADPISCFPDFNDVPTTTFSERSADARLISEALAETSEDSTMLYCLDVIDEETDGPCRTVNEKDTDDDLANLLCCSTSDEGSSLVPGASFHASAAESGEGPTASTSESASNSPRCAQSAFCASSKLAPINAFASAFSHKSGGPCDHCGATGRGHTHGMPLATEHTYSGSCSDTALGWLVSLVNWYHICGGGCPAFVLPV